MNDPKVEKLFLRARSGNGAVPTGSYTLLVPNNNKRRWLSITIPPATDPTAAGLATLIVLPMIGGVTGDTYGQIYLDAGSSVILSMTGDMPWQGSVLATGLAGASYVYWTEVEDYP